ncbi:MAG: hypothetical protein IJY71_07390 [Clostridia bacterium]|nr:hypothetical protein [Clostridia bacterium]
MFLFGKRKQEQLEEERRRQEEERQRQEEERQRQEQRKQRLLSAPIIQDFIQKSIDKGVTLLANIKRPGSTEWVEQFFELEVCKFFCRFSNGVVPWTDLNSVVLNFSQAHYPDLSLSDARILVTAMMNIIINEIAKKWDNYPGKTDRECKLTINKMHEVDGVYLCSTNYRAKNAAYHQGWNSW